ncbi:MAG: hypothetical protein Q7K42_06350, partial [Candidatus Diapherotrites archaeon]|nr:hypothetical protein [Candidatus Diapherotrites archaeon]
KRLEGEKPKGITIYDTELGTTNFLPLPVQRKLFYHKLKFENSSLEQITAKLRETIEQELNGKTFELKPLFRIKIVGSLLKGLSQSDLDFDELVKSYSDSAIFSVDKNLFSDGFKSKISELRELQQSNKSIATLGLEFLEKNLAETSFDKGFDVKQLFDLLADGEIDKAFELLDAFNSTEKEKIILKE